MTSDEIKKAREYIAEHCMDGHVARGWLAALDEIERLQGLYEGCLTKPYADELGRQYDEMQAEAEAWKQSALAYEDYSVASHEDDKAASLDNAEYWLTEARALEGSHCENKTPGHLGRTPMSQFAWKSLKFEDEKNSPVFHYFDCGDICVDVCPKGYGAAREGAPWTIELNQASSGAKLTKPKGNYKHLRNAKKAAMRLMADYLRKMSDDLQVAADELTRTGRDSGND